MMAASKLKRRIGWQRHFGGQYSGVKHRSRKRRPWRAARGLPAVASGLAHHPQRRHRFRARNNFDEGF